MTRITVQQIRSPIRRPYDQRLTLIGLKLNKIGRIVELPDTPQARGMITKVAHLLRTIGQETELDCFTRAVRAKYQDLITTRIRRGEVLWSQFEAAVEACRADPKGDDRQSTEKVNEMAVAKALLDDQAIPWPMTYEPDLLPDGRKIDFVVDRGADNLYIEVKTVRPRTADTDAAWEKFLARRRRHPENVNVILEKDWMGGAIYGNLFASRSHFLDFTVDFEVRLAAAQAIKPGHGILIFCGTGFAWHKSNVEDFADFYLTGRHRGDDPFALMEQHHIEEEKNQAAAQYRSFCIFAPPYRRAEQGGIPLSRSRPAFFLAPPRPLETVAS